MHLRSTSGLSRKFRIFLSLEFSTCARHGHSQSMYVHGYGHVLSQLRPPPWSTWALHKAWFHLIDSFTVDSPPSLTYLVSFQNRAKRQSWWQQTTKRRMRGSGFTSASSICWYEYESTMSIDAWSYSCITCLCIKMKNAVIYAHLKDPQTAVTLPTLGILA